MRRGIIEALIFISGCIVIVYLLKAKDIAKPEFAILLAILINIITTPLYVGVVEFIYSVKNLRLIFKTKFQYRNENVRISIAYLFRIKHKGKYLLVKNRKANYYQLVGGAYKAFPGARNIFNKLGVKTDNRFETEHGIAKNDLRFRVPGVNVLRIIQWFNSRADREISQWREFCEELLTSNIISEARDRYAFRYIDYEYKTTVQTPIQKAKNLDCQEILIYEIFDLIPNSDQEEVLEKLYQIRNSEVFKWADEKIIETLGFDERTKETEFDIAPHTKWAIKEKYSKE